MKWRWIGGNLSKQIWDKQRQMLLYYCSTHCRRISRDLYIRRILAHPSSIHVPERELGPASNYCKRPDRMHDNDVAFDYRSPVAGGFDGWAMRQQSVPLLCRMAVYRPNSLVIRHRAPSTRGEPSPWWGLLIEKKRNVNNWAFLQEVSEDITYPLGTPMQRQPWRMCLISLRHTFGPARPVLRSAIVHRRRSTSGAEVVSHLNERMMMHCVFDGVNVILHYG